MTDYLLDTNILLRLVQPQSPAHTPAVEAVAAILGNGDNIDDFQRYSNIIVVSPNHL